MKISKQEKTQVRKERRKVLECKSAVIIAKLSSYFQSLIFYERLLKRR